MPEIGEIRRGCETGHNRKERYIWAACEICGKERWTILSHNKPHNKRCISCAKKGIPHSEETKQKMHLVTGEKTNNWKGGRVIDRGGYLQLKLYPNDFFYPMARKQGYVLEHRLVVAKSLGRNLHRWELVHHKNHIKTDNRLDNLQLVGTDKHLQITLLDKRITYLENRVILLEAENCLLREGERRTMVNRITEEVK